MSPSELANAADQAIAVALRIAVATGLPSRGIMDAARDALMEIARCSSSKATRELRDAMVRRAASTPKTRAVAESYLSRGKHG